MAPALLPGDELTATECASLTGLSPSATSYHLKALERWGIVEAGQARADGRDRPWKARGRSIEVSSDTPSTVLAETAVLEVFMDRNRALATEFLEHQADEPAQWRDTMELGNGDYWLTAGELTEISAALRRVLEPYEQRRPGFPAGREPAGADSAPHRAEGRAALGAGSGHRAESGEAALRAGQQVQLAVMGERAAAHGSRRGAALVQHRTTGAARLHHVDAPVTGAPVTARVQGRPGADAGHQYDQQPAHDGEHPLLAGRERFPMRIGLAASHAGQA